MLVSSIPTKMPTAFAQNANPSFIRTVPIPSQIGISAGAASFNDGFVPLNFTPTSSSGVPPFGQDFNGLLNAVTAWLRWDQAGAPMNWDSSFSSSVGGYPAGAMVGSNIVVGKRWMSLVDNNTTNPDDITSANWVTPPGVMPSGTPVPSFSSTLNPSGYVTANGQTIGDGSSGAGYANANALFLFVAVWNQFPNSQCQLFNSSGSPISRGANPYADFAAHTRLTTPSLQGSGLIGVDTMGGGATSFLTGVPVVTGNTTSPGSVLGEDRHTLTASELPSVSVSVTSTISTIATAITTFSNGTGGGLFCVQSVGSVTSTGSSTNTGGNPHNNVERSYSNYWNLVL